MLRFQLADTSGQSFYNSGTFVADRQWNNICISVDRDNTAGGTFYVNGSPVQPFDPTGRTGSLDNDFPLRLGRRSDSSLPGFYEGVMDDLALYQRALSVAEVKAVFDGGAGGMYRPRS